MGIGGFTIACRRDIRRSQYEMAWPIDWMQHRAHGSQLELFHGPTQLELVQAWLRGVTKQIPVNVPMGVAYGTTVGLCVGRPHPSEEAVSWAVYLGDMLRRLP